MVAGVLGELGGAIGDAVAALVKGVPVEPVGERRGDLVPGVAVEREAVQGDGRHGRVAAPVDVVQVEIVDSRGRVARCGVAHGRGLPDGWVDHRWRSLTLSWSRCRGVEVGGAVVAGVAQDDWLALPDAELQAQCRFDRFRVSGPGGQHRNRRNTAVRLVHEPTG